MSIKPATKFDYIEDCGRGNGALFMMVPVPGSSCTSSRN